MLAYTEQTAFLRLARDAATSPSPQEKVSHTFLAGAAFGRYERVCTKLTSLGADPIALLAKFDGLYDDYEERTPAEKWHELVLKGYVGHAVAIDFCQLVAPSLTADASAFVAHILAEDSASGAEEDILLRDCAADPILASRLALWGRRLMGELLNQVQALIAAQPALERLAIAAATQAGAKIEGQTPQESKKLLTGWVFTQLTSEHARRMDRLGLAA